MKKFISNRKIIFLLISVLCITSLVGCGSNGEKTAEENKVKSKENDAKEDEVGEDEKYGGEITVAFQSAPENFDPDHSSTDWTVTAITNHVYEGLFEFDDDNKVVPHLAESYEILDDGKTYHIKLREGVKFQDGDELKAEDVKASFERWIKVNPVGDQIKDDIDSVEIVNDYEIDIKFNKVYAPFLNILGSPVSRQKMLVKKKEIIDKFGDSIITEHIGTGPYYFDDIVMGQKVLLKRNDNYVPLEGTKASGLAGERVPYLDSINIEFASEESVRVAGLKSGQFDFIDELSSDRYDEVNNYSEIEPVICKHGTMSVMAYNAGKTPFDDPNLRKAVAHAINPREMAAAQVGDEMFWSVEDGSWFKEGNIWHDADAGKGIYDSQDLEKAKKYIEESDYNNEKIVILGEKENSYISNGSLVLQDQLKEIGLNVEVELVDRSTFGDKREDGKWDIVMSRWSDMNPDPQVFEPWTGTDGWITNWDDEDSRKMDEIFERMVSEIDYEKRYEIVQEFYDEFWESVPYLKIFNDKRLYGINEDLKGYTAYGQPYFWNVWLER